ncbi:hypothetical protein ACJMK2_005414, partial [Sinanodonta woodiana]
MGPTMTCEIICEDVLVSKRFNEVGDDKFETVKLARENYWCLKEFYRRFPDEVVSFDTKRDAIAALAVADVFG